ncbi:DUF4360 domain-containing protein [Streptomyces mobaraensis NBRC 13819 = DSM 40847]|uniref:DUF4360 domain-containing protein n=2 Tax=Streptomyces mobaraensis TaxID=35621 RepID=A0A5N5VZW5_STRMB|nr:DUF4360 domain-containing protein [Streptomyces mobaraensis]EMF01561.1 secreted protein [Streptomyces mobaraensis NBRC 13819 = DSM 40847]KAB7833773.1 DUF4360 domain-containing protein [Streptomyces mobaraensis]QTT72179.1 DUF4360 domain-containing protein [Streptomyces mobaraensis NBRC 13819 = DSM 40847]
MWKPALIGTAAVALAATAFSPQAAAAEGAPPPGRIQIDVVSVNGSGCPAGTAAVAVAGDNTAFTVSYSNYLAQVGVGSKPTDFRKNCQLGLNVHVPQGYTYAIAKADYRGFAHLQSGATGLEKASYYFQGMQQTTSTSHRFSGPFSDDWQTTDVTDVDALVYAPCGTQRILNVNTELRVSAGTSDPGSTTSFMAMDSADGSVNTLYHFEWKQCS